LREYVVPELDILLRVALRLTRDHQDAEDLVQETLLRAYRAVDRFDGAWLATVQAHGTFVDQEQRGDVLVKREDGQLLLMRIPGS
jgi:RNA polymerase sigma-70 factor (ECF subfamily)